MQQTCIVSKKRANTVKLVTAAMLSALSAVLMMFSVNVPLMPSFLKLDFSELPAMIAAFLLGPVWGVAVCLVKNLVNLSFTTTGGVGELANFLLGASLVLPAGLIYHVRRRFSGAMLGCAAGLVFMVLFSLPVNYFIVYPFYTVVMPMEVILGMYQAINPKVNTLWDALLWFNAPFTLIKALAVSIMTFLVYKPLFRGLNKLLCG